MKHLFLISFVIFIFLFSANFGFAQTSPGISITPSLIQLDLSRDPPQTEISYTNNTNNPVSLHISAKDFSAFDEQGRFNFLEGQDAKNYHYSLSSWIHFETTDVTLNPHETKAIDIEIDKNRLTIGGHYASILTEIQEQNLSGQVSVHAVAATILFIRTGTSNQDEEAIFNNVSISQSFFSFPDKINVRFQNTGNVQLTPYGLITIKDPFGQIVASSIFNEASAITLPESVRKYVTAVSSPRQFMLPGIYSATIALHFGEKNKQITISKQFFTFGDSLTLVIGIIMLTIVGVIVLRIIRKKTHLLHRS